MSFPIIAAVFGVLIIGVLFFLARRALRLIVRLALVCMLVLLLLGGGLAWWWYGDDSSPASKPYGGSPAGSRRTTAR